MDASADITVQTNLLEARLLCGSKALFDELCASVQQHLDLRAFYLAKLQEQQRRHARYAEADYNLEPNLKESRRPARFADRHLDCARSRAGTHWSELAQIGLLTAARRARSRATARCWQRCASACITSPSATKTACCSIFKRCSPNN